METIDAAYAHLERILCLNHFMQIYAATWDRFFAFIKPDIQDQLLINSTHIAVDT